MDTQAHKNIEKKNVAATSRTNPEIKKKLQEISRFLIEKNKVSYRKLANQ